MNMSPARVYGNKEPVEKRIVPGSGNAGIRAMLKGAATTLVPGLALPISDEEADAPMASEMGGVAAGVIPVAKILSMFGGKGIKAAENIRHITTEDEVKKMLSEVKDLPGMPTGMHRAIVEKYIVRHKQPGQGLQYEGLPNENNEPQFYVDGYLGEMSRFKDNLYSPEPGMGNQPGRVLGMHVPEKDMPPMQGALEDDPFYKKIQAQHQADLYGERKVKYQQEVDAENARRSTNTDVEGANPYKQQRLDKLMREWEANPIPRPPMSPELEGLLKKRFGVTP